MTNNTTDVCLMTGDKTTLSFHNLTDEEFNALNPDNVRKNKRDGFKYRSGDITIGDISCSIFTKSVGDISCSIFTKLV